MNNDERKIENLNKVFKPEQAAQIYVANVPLLEGHQGFTYSQMRQTFTAGVTWANELEKRNYKSRFNEGWWNCLDSFYQQTSNESAAYKVMDEAGIEEREVLWAIKMGIVGETTTNMLKEYAKDRFNTDIV